MKMLQAAPIIQALLILASCTTTATIAHYAEPWGIAYAVVIVFAAFGALITHLALEGKIS